VILLKELTTTTIGSFPLKAGVEEFERCLELQVKAGVDYPALPQLEDFCEIFLRDIAERGKGLKREEARYVLIEPIEPPKEPSIINDVSLAISTLKRLSSDVKLKVQVTGPFTLSSLVKFLDKTAMSYPDVVESFSDAIAYILAAACSFDEVEVAFVDEPMTYYALWSGYDENFVVNVINRALKGVGNAVEKGIHICGDARGLSRVTLRLNVEVVHHEVVGMPKNLDAYNADDVIKAGKLLGVGVVASKPLDSEVNVEGEDYVLSLMRKAAEKFHGKVVFAPDCGFRGLSEVLPPEKAIEVVYNKMRVMCSSARILRKELGLNY